MSFFLKKLLKRRGRQLSFGNIWSLNYIKHNLKGKALIASVAGIGGVTTFNSKSQTEEGSFTSYFWASIRFLRSLKIGITISMDYYFATIGLNENLANYKPMMSLLHKRAAIRILDGCLTNGGTYIKLGQGLVSLSHILPVEYIEILSSLQDKCLNRDPSEIYQIIEEDFGKQSWELFNWIDKNPVAAASLAQVYKAETRNGDLVAIKVQYIDLQSRFVSDVATIDFLLKIIGFIHPNFNFGWVLSDLSSNLREELDFLNEGCNAEKCARDLKDHKFVYIPKVHWDLSSSRFLVTEFIDAIKVNDVDKLKKERFNLYDIDLKIFEAFGHQIFKTGFVHADPHPGNLLVRRKNNTTEIVMLDHGLYQEIEERTRIALSGMWKAIVLQNYKEMEFYANTLGIKDYEIFAEILTQRPIRTVGFKLTTRITNEQMQYMTEAAQHRFDEIMQVLRIMPRSLLLVIRNLNTIRSITHDHGDPIDRYAVLARCATYTYIRHGTMLTRISTIPGRLYFEFKIFSGKIWVWFMKTYLKVLSILGRSPDANVLVANLG